MPLGSGSVGVVSSGAESVGGGSLGASGSFDCARAVGASSAANVKGAATSNVRREEVSAGMTTSRRWAQEARVTR
jgi:hypothetical protein